MKKFKKIYVEITNICNLNCSFCSKDNLPKKEMDVQSFEHILNKIDDFTDYLYLHVKGEPLLHSNFHEILKLCNRYNKLVNITTNGTLLFDKLDFIMDSNIRQINISFQSITSIEVLKSILDGSKILLEKTKIEIVFRFWAINNGLNEVQLKMIDYIINYFGLDLDVKNSIILKDNVKIMEHLYINKDVEFIWPNLDEKDISSYGTCYGLRNHLAILVDGTVIPCCLDSKGIINLGNIFNETLDNILKKERSVKIIKGFQNKNIEEQLCLKCNYRKRFDSYDKGKIKISTQ